MKQIKHIGCYGLIVQNNNILLIDKFGGPYDGKLDLPGGTIEYNEKPTDTLVRELKEEVGIDIINYELLDCDSVNIEWFHKKELEQIHHIAIFYRINDFTNNIKENINITKQNDDSRGAKYYNINKLEKNKLSEIVILGLEKLGFKL